MVKQKKEISDKIVIVLLILAILFSVGGSILIYESVQGFRDGIDRESKVSSGTGFVSLEVIDNVNSGGESSENIE
jgi:hypothetical protein